MAHIIAMMLHPHGWWIVLDTLIFGSTVTLCLVAADDNDWI
jgi:hypothetical protein